MLLRLLLLLLLLPPLLLPPLLLLLLLLTSGVRSLCEQAFCIFEEPTLSSHWRHMQLVNKAVDGVPATTLVVRAVTAVGNYDYLTEFRFNLDGSLRVKFDFAGCRLPLLPSLALPSYHLLPSPSILPYQVHGDALVLAAANAVGALPRRDRARQPRRAPALALWVLQGGAGPHGTTLDPCVATSWTRV